MKETNDVYVLDEELVRLGVQSRLLKEYEQPMYDSIFSGKQGAAVLDIGCNDGSKTVDRFQRKEVRRVIGLEYHEHLAAEANERYRNDRFQFYHANVESEQFEETLTAILNETGEKGFDVINLSFLLVNLKQPARLLARLKPFLNPGGMLAIVDPDDRLSRMAPDENHRMKFFLQVCEADPLAGKRYFEGELTNYLSSCGYQDIHVHSSCVSSELADRKKRDMMFQTFFSYIPNDYESLCSQAPENHEYARVRQQISENFEPFRTEFMNRADHVECGVLLISCSL